MDTLATAAEIATILQAAEAVPHLPKRRVSRKERQEAYFEYQREVHQLMTGINHLSFLAGVKTTAWQTSGVAVIPMLSPFVDFMLPDEPSSRAAARRVQENLRFLASIARAMSPTVGPILATVHEGGNQLRTQALSDIAKLNDSLAAYLTALAKVRLVGRPGPVRAAEVILELLQELISRLPAYEAQPRYRRVLPGAKKEKSSELRKFNHCLQALGSASTQFMSAVREDRSGRHFSWQVWKRVPPPISSADELLGHDSQPATPIEQHPSS